ncbi:MAG: response regulator [Pontiellaceae bacterium]|nr:response regulator [Pontiellaceae bacterium]
MATVLVIEDDVFVRELIVDILKGTKSEIYECEDGAKGLDLAMKIKPDLVITDILMPNIDGEEVIRILRQEKPNTKIIAISGGGFNRKEYYLQIAMALGSNNVLSKPFDPNDLLSMIENELNELCPMP